MSRPRHRGNGDGTLYQIPGRRRPWAAALTVGWTLEGRPIRRARFASSEREAKAMLLEMIAARETARPMPDDRMTVGKWLRLWIDSPSVTGLRASTNRHYRYAVGLLLPELGNVPLRKLRSPTIEAAIARLPRDAAVNARAVLSTAIKDAMRAGHVTTNEAALARTPRSPARKLVAPDTATVRALLDELSNHRLHALYVLLAGTGLRIGEATGLRWEDIHDGLAGAGSGQAGAGTDGLDLATAGRLRRGRASGVAAGQGAGAHGSDGRDAAMASVVGEGVCAAPSLTVTYQVQRINGELVHTDPKTDTAGRVVFLPPVLQAALRAHKARQAAERLAAGSKWRRTDEHGPDEQLVFTTLTGQPLSEQTAHWVLARACERAGTRHVGLHDLRRWAASQLEDALGRDTAQLVLGHTAPVMTERYVTVRDTMLSRAADAIEEAIG